MYTIKRAAELTGVPAATLRAWERRYGLLHPQRTAGGHRVYTRADLDTLHRIRALVEGGMAIGQVGHALGVLARGGVLGVHRAGQQRHGAGHAQALAVQDQGGQAGQFDGQPDRAPVAGIQWHQSS